MASWKNSVAIHAPVDRVFGYVDDPTTLAEWLPGMFQVHSVNGAAEGQQHEWTYKMAGVPLRGQAVVVEHVPNVRAVHQSIGMIHVTFAYSVDSVDEGTLLTLEIEYTIPVPVLGRLAERIVLARNEREFEMALTNVKEALEA
jgi:carbon monoxide dehydrogenase subunit G